MIGRGKQGLRRREREDATSTAAQQQAQQGAAGPAAAATRLSRKQGISRERSTCSSQECRRECRQECRRECRGMPGAAGCRRQARRARTRRSARRGSGSSRRSSARSASSSSIARGTRVRTARRSRQQAAAAPAKLQKLKTQAFVIDSSGGPAACSCSAGSSRCRARSRASCSRSSRSRHRHTPDCNDRAATTSSCRRKHAEIKAENGMWILRDIGLDQRHLRQQPVASIATSSSTTTSSSSARRCEVQEPMKRVLLLLFIARCSGSFARDSRARGRRRRRGLPRGQAARSDGPQDKEQAPQIEATVDRRARQHPDRQVHALRTGREARRSRSRPSKHARLHRGHRDDRDRARHQRPGDLDRQRRRSPRTTRTRSIPACSRTSSRRSTAAVRRARGPPGCKGIVIIVHRQGAESRSRWAPLDEHHRRRARHSEGLPAQDRHRAWCKGIDAWRSPSSKGVDARARR